VENQYDKGLDFIIDKFTNSIENTLTSEVFDTEVVRLSFVDAKQIKKSNWQFNWHKELMDNTKEVYKLTTVNNPTIIQGLLSIEDKHYEETLHATHFRGLRMFIETNAALRLISKYFRT